MMRADRKEVEEVRLCGHRPRHGSCWLELSGVGEPIVEDDEAFDGLYLRTLRCSEQEAGGCGEDQRGDKGAEVSGCLAEVLCFLVDGVGIHAGLL